MSVSMGCFLRYCLSKPNKPSRSSILSILLLITLLGAIAFSTTGSCSALAELGSKGYRNITTKLKSAGLQARPDTRHSPASAAGNVNILSPLQACDLGCNATVPATGTAGSTVSFQASATATGCATQPTYEW